MVCLSSGSSDISVSIKCIFRKLFFLISSITSPKCRLTSEELAGRSDGHLLYLLLLMFISFAWSQVNGALFDKLDSLISPQNKWFSCYIVWSQFWKSSFLWPPCWFSFVRLCIVSHNIATLLLFSSYHNAKLWLRNENFSTNILLKLKSYYKIKSNTVFCRFSLYHAIQRGDQELGQNCVRLCVHRVVQSVYYTSITDKSVNEYLPCTAFASRNSSNMPWWKY